VRRAEPLFLFLGVTRMSSLGGGDYSTDIHSPRSVSWLVAALVIGAELALFWWLA
jgi:hypothetical protein